MRGVDSCPGERTVEFCRVNVAEFVGAHGVLAEISGENRHREGSHRVVEEGLLLLGLDCVEFGECETDEAVGLCVLDEGGGDCGGELDSLAGDCRAADVDGVCSDVTSGSGSVTVGDRKGRSCHHLESRGFLGVEVRVAGLGGCC